MKEPTIRELCERAKGFPAVPGSGTALAQLEKRLSPDVVLKVVASMEQAAAWLKELADDGDAADWVLEKHTELATEMNTTLSLLNHPHDQHGEKKS